MCEFMVRIPKLVSQVALSRGSTGSRLRRAGTVLLTRPCTVLPFTPRGQRPAYRTPPAGAASATCVTPRNAPLFVRSGQLVGKLRPGTDTAAHEQQDTVAAGRMWEHPGL